MENKIHINVSDNDRAKFERFKRKHSQNPRLTQKTTTKEPEEPESAIFITEEEIFETALNSLIEGMKTGNQVDKKAAEALVQSIKYKFSKEFADKCVIIFEEALKEHEAFLKEGLFSNIAKATQNMAEQIKKITGQIFSQDNGEPERT